MPADPDAVARFLAALAEGTCLRIVEHLAAGPAHTTGVAAALGLKMVNASHHMVDLRNAGVVEAERAGRFVLYKLAGAEVAGGELILRRQGVTLSMPLAPPAKTGKKNSPAGGEPSAQARFPS